MSETTTPHPTVKVASDLTAIEEMAGALEDQAEHDANSSLMPGGKAMVALGYVANLESWEHHYESAERLGRPASHVDDEDDTWEPPLQTLCFWSEQWRVEHGAEYDKRPTLTSEVNFIRWALDWAWQNELHWEDFAQDIRQARLRLEDVVHDGKRAERTRVPCTNEDCERKPRLIKVYAWDPAEDGFKCTSCKSLYDQQEFARATLRLLWDDKGGERYVKAQDARDVIGRPPRTWSKWLRYWYIRSYRDKVSGQVWVWWPDAREVEAATQRRERAAARKRAEKEVAA